jgi:hypothetical protein
VVFTFDGSASDPREPDAASDPPGVARSPEVDPPDDDPLPREDPPARDVVPEPVAVDELPSDVEADPVATEASPGPPGPASPVSELAAAPSTFASCLPSAPWASSRFSARLLGRFVDPADGMFSLYWSTAEVAADADPEAARLRTTVVTTATGRRTPFSTHRTTGT